MFFGQRGKSFFEGGGKEHVDYQKKKTAAGNFFSSKRGFPTSG